MTVTPPNDPYGQIPPGPVPDHATPQGRTADGGGIFRALSSIFGAVFFICVSLGFVSYAIYLSVAGSSDSPADTQKADKAADEAASKSSAGEEPDTETPPELQLVSATPVPDVIGNVYVFCMVKYTGEKNAAFLRIDVTLTDASGGEVAKGFGYSLLNTVRPGQTVPVSVLVKKPGEYAKIKTHLTFRSAGSTESIELAVSDAKMTTTPSVYVEGRLTNNSTVAAGSAHAVGVVYDSAGVACGAGSGYTASKVLAPGATEPFKAYIHPAKCKPVRFEVLTEGTPK